MSKSWNRSGFAHIGYRAFSYLSYYFSFLLPLYWGWDRPQGLSLDGRIKATFPILVQHSYGTGGNLCAFEHNIQFISSWYTMSLREFVSDGMVS